MRKSYHGCANLRHRIRRPATTIGIDGALAGLKPELDRMGYRTRVYGEISKEATHRQLLADRVHFFVTRRGWWFFGGFDQRYDHGYSVLDIKIGYESIGLARVLDKILMQKIDRRHRWWIVGRYVRVTQALVNTLD
jgi:hypothetical protein